MILINISWLCNKYVFAHFSDTLLDGKFDNIDVPSGSLSDLKYCSCLTKG